MFYTNGSKVLNRERELMPNGDSLLIGQDSDIGSSITQGVVILPQPSSNKFYIIQLQYAGVRYSIVDMDMDGGFGDVEFKNVLIDTGYYIREHMQAIKHGNGIDWWILMHRYDEFIGALDTTLSFETFLLTESEIQGPFLQTFGPPFNINDGGDGGQMVVSRNGDKLAYARGKFIDLYDFDRCNGELSDLKTIQYSEEFWVYGLAFSGNASKLYASMTDALFHPNQLIQYCLDCPDSLKQTVFNNTLGEYSFGQMLLGPDERIYISLPKVSWPNDTLTFFNNNLCVINYPNELFPVCDFDTATISLGMGRATYGLPNMPNYNLGPLHGSDCDTVKSPIQTVLPPNDYNIYPNPVNDHFIISSGYTGNKIDLELYNSVGEIVFKQQDILLNTEINLPQLPSGMYTVKLMEENILLFTDKIIIKH
ncbi:MAG: T9SS type A sorting domain-containing protein [Chitinophagales bacterium]